MATDDLAEKAQALLDQADTFDPGLDKATTWSSNERTRTRYRNIARHWEAVGIRHALIELGLWNPTREDGA